MSFLDTDMEVVMSLKKYVVDLTDAEREVCKDVVKKLKGTSQKVKRANILLKADRGWKDAKIAQALDCRTSTVERVRRRFVEAGFEETVDGKKRATPPVEKLLNGEQEAKVIAMRLGDPPKGFGKWTLRLLARKVVELGIVESISHQTIRRTLKKTK
jgi:transposase